MSFLEKKIEPLIRKKKEDNLRKFGQEYVRYSPDQLRFLTQDGPGYSDKVLRIPSACFVTVEYCHSFPNEKNGGRMYHLATYSPSELPLALKCGAFLGTGEDAIPKNDRYRIVFKRKAEKHLFRGFFRGNPQSSG